MEKTQNRKLLSNFVSLGIIQGTNFLLPLIVMPYVIKRVGADGFGIISVAQVLMIYLSTITDYGFNLTATRDIAVAREDKSQLSRIFYTVLYSKLIICAGCLLLLVLLVFAVPLFHAHAALYLLGFTYVLGQSLMVSWFFQGLERMQYITVISLLARLVFVALVFSFIHRANDGQYFLLFLGAGNIIAGIFSIGLAIKLAGIDYYAPSRADIRAEMREGWQVMFSNVSINTYMYLNVFILRLFTNDLVVGYYSIAEKIFFAARQVLGIFSQIIYPRICQLIINRKTSVAAFLKSFYLPFLLLLIAACTVLFIFSPFIVTIFLGSPVHTSVVLLRMLSFVPVVVCLNIPAYQVLLALNQKNSYLRVLSVGTLVNLAANLVLAPTLGPVGTALSIIITELFITLGLNLELSKNKLWEHLKPGAT